MSLASGVRFRGKSGQPVRLAECLQITPSDIVRPRWFDETALPFPLVALELLVEEHVAQCRFDRVKFPSGDLVHERVHAAGACKSKM